MRVSLCRIPSPSLNLLLLLVFVISTAERVCCGPLQQQQQQQLSWSTGLFALHQHQSRSVSRSSQPAGGEATLSQITQNQTRYICSASELIGQSLKKAVFFLFLSMFLSQFNPGALSLCICVCVDPPKAACAPLFQMTLFTDITQPPRIPRQNLISREHQRRRGQNAEGRRIFAGSKPGAGLLKLTFHHACRHQEKKNRKIISEVKLRWRSFLHFG